MPESAGTVTALLQLSREGDEAATEELWRSVHAELRRLASGLMAREQPGQTLQPTALVNEAYIRLLGDDQPETKDRRYFFASAAHAMRRILVERARKGGEAKARAQENRVPLDMASLTAGDVSPDDVDALEAALDALKNHDERIYDVIMLRFFAGLSTEQIAELFEVTPRTIRRDWNYGRAWLEREMTPADKESAPGENTTDGE